MTTAKSLPIDDFLPEKALFDSSALNKEQNSQQTWQKKPRKRPLSRFTQSEQSPGFYLSLSDLMSLLLVFFVLIFSLSDYQKKNPEQTIKAEKPAKIVKAIPLGVTQEKKAKGIDPFSNPPLFPSVVPIAKKSVATKGSFDPGLKAEPKFTQTETEVPWVEHQPEIKKTMLSVLTSSAVLPVSAVPDEDTSLNSLLNKVRKEVKEKGPQGVELEASPKTLIVRLPEAITFDLGKAEIKAAMTDTLKRLGAILAKHKGYKVIVTGHTDDLPIKNETFASNWDLSAARAAKVANRLLDQGLDTSLLTIKGMADQSPIASNNTLEGRQQNRRVEIELKTEKAGTTDFTQKKPEKLNLG